MGEEVLTLAGVSKSFGTTHALSDVSFSVRAGEVHALLGENGAGKSTLIKIVTAVLRPDAGRVAVLGEPVPFGRPGAVIARGLSTVYQDLSLISGLTVAANLDLGRPGVMRAPSRSERAAAAVLESFDVHDFGPADLVDELSFGQRQRLEIVRALGRHPRILLLDEPTSALGQPEVEWLFERLGQEVARGTAIVLISHRMGDIREICDRVTILRNGRNVGTSAASEISDAQIVQMMLGRNLAAAFPERTATRSPNEPILEIRGLVVPPLLRDVTFTLAAGEVLGLAGLDGQGQRQVLRALAGIAHPLAGEIFRRGRAVRISSPASAIRAGLALVPADRAREGLLMPMTVAENMSLPVVDRFVRRILIDERAERSAVAATAESLGLAADRVGSPVSALSGGNQQKVLLGKWLMTDAEVIMLDDPTQGVDVGTKYEIGTQVMRLADAGKGILLYSTDLDELVHLADRVLVFYQGSVVAELRGPDLDAEAILTPMTGHAGAHVHEGASVSAAIAAALPTWRRGLPRFVGRNQGSLLSGVLLVLLLVIYQAQAGKIVSPIQVRILLNGALSLVWAAIGLTFVVVAGGFDLSVGSVMSVANVLAATFIAGSATDPPVIVLILAIGALAGLANGLLVAVAGIQSIIVTLAAMFVWSGVALLVMPQPGGQIPGYFSDLFGGSITPTIPNAVVWLVAILGALAIFRRTAAWSVLFSVGGDEVRARRSGVHVTRAKLLAYVAAGVCYATAGLFLGAQSTGGDANIGNPFLLTTFAAVILGGTPLGGGRGTFLGAIFGALVVATLGSVLLGLGVTSYWTDIVQGAVLILAVVLPTMATRSARRRVAAGGR